jgi:hypothetical protein
MNGRGILVTVFCNHCGDRFSTNRHHSRFCSRACASRFWAPIPRERTTALVAWAQAALLDYLRSRPGEWIARAEIARAIYRVDDASTQHCLRMVVYRLRGTWADAGLVIDSRVDHSGLGRYGATYYRLVQDIQTDTQEVAS